MVRISTVILALALIGKAATDPVPLHLRLPQGWPRPVHDFERSPLTVEGVALGRRLFYDPILSADSTISCASCHLSYTAFTHVDHSLSHGIHDSIGTRNSPVLINLAWNRELMWDGAVNHIEVQALAPINHPAEMGETTVHVVNKLRKSARYPKLFALAFGDTAITGQRLLKALAQFQLTLISSDSRYDRMLAGTERFSAQEENGLRLFRQHCATCHAEPLFTTGGFANNGLPMDTLLRDVGRMRVTGLAADSLLFKIPNLRNLEFSFPYMHDGRFRSIREVIRHYTAGIADSPTLDPRLRGGVRLSNHEVTDLTAFLLTLTDKTFLFNPDHAFPKE